MYFRLTPEGGAVVTCCEVAEILKSKKRKLKSSLVHLVEYFPQKQGFSPASTLQTQVFNFVFHISVPLIIFLSSSAMTAIVRVFDFHSTVEWLSVNLLRLTGGSLMRFYKPKSPAIFTVIQTPNVRRILSWIQWVWKADDLHAVGATLFAVLSVWRLLLPVSHGSWVKSYMS